jgi:hypothetical protein
MANVLQDAPESSIASLAGGIIADAQTLFKQELALAKREIADELIKAKEAAISLALGIGMASLGALSLMFMLVYFLGKKKAGALHLLPEQTIASMKDNVEWIKNQT